MDKVENQVTATQQETPHKRRQRYNGTHPKAYKEKYKELQPEKYTETVDKIIGKGNTPVGMHISICVKEILGFLQIKPGQIGLDATLGYGGHTTEMLKCLESQGHMVGLDIDPIEIVKTRERMLNKGFGPEILTIKNINFADVDLAAPTDGYFNFALADLGVSSMQLDNPERGFSYKKDGPLDLRLNPERGISAAERLKTIKQPELEGMLTENADEPHAYEISKAIIHHRRTGKPLSTTTHLQEIIAEVLKNVPAADRKLAIKKSCQRTFQALRIDVNNEYEVLFDFLEKLPDVMAKDGRIAILTFHSGEDRLVKKSFKRLLRAGVYKEISDDVIRPSAEECRNNSRASSTKMRWAIKA